MARVVTFGRMPGQIPPGNFREVYYPQLALLDQGTGEGYISRFLHSDGGGTRELPRTISLQYMDTFGHDNAAAVGSLWEVTIDGEAGIMSGRGYLADTPDGHLAEVLAVSKALHHNSVDLTDIPPNGLRIVEHGDWWDEDWHADLHFDIWNLGKTTSVATPAFANARYEVVDGGIVAALERFAEQAGLDQSTVDEVRASIGLAEPLVIDIPTIAEGHTAFEVAAGLTVKGLPKFDYFCRPEPDIPHKIMVDEPDENGWCHVYGHLAQWGVAHTSITGRTVYARRSNDDYARFCQPGVLTDKGLARCGPISLYDGHRPLKECADDPATAWADVRVVDGRHGPWISGIARPHISHEMAERYVARASRTSGHWEYDGGPLRMIVSVNAEGFPIDFKQDALGIAASFSLDDEPASVPVMIPSELLHFAELTPEAQGKARTWIESMRTFATGGNITVVDVSTPSEPTVLSESADDSDTFDVDAAARERARALALQAHDD